MNYDVAIKMGLDTVALTFDEFDRLFQFALSCNVIGHHIARHLRWLIKQESPTYSGTLNVHKLICMVEG